MKFKLSNMSWILVPSLLLGGCDPEFSSPVGDSDDYDAGSADPAGFITVGDSLTAGYMDGALFRQGQMNSYGNIIAGQLDMIPGQDVDFNQPLMPAGATGSLTGVPTSVVRDRLVVWPNPDYDPTDPSSRPVTPDTIDPTSTSDMYPAVTASGPFDNLGVPGAKSFHLSPVATNYGDPAGVAGGTANPFFVRFASSTTTSVLADVAARAPSLFVLWIGNNDVLLYAADGGVGEDRTGNTDPTTYGPEDDITDPNVVAGSIQAVLATVKNANNKAVIGNVPDVAAIPYFTTVPFDAIPLDAATAAFLNSNPDIAAYNAGVTASIGFNGLTAEEAAARQIEFVEGNNPVLMLDDELTDLTGVPGSGGALIALRQATAADFILLPTASKLGEEDTPGDQTTVWGVSKPLEDGDVLSEAEAAFVETARQAYNAAIAGFAADPEILLFDAAALLDDLNDGGINYGTGTITSAFLTGGGFSLDGVHPTARGYAVIANAIIDVINEGFNASIPRVDPGAYPTVYYQ